VDLLLPLHRLTEVIEVKGWPESMQVICRRERPHPGAQLSLFDTTPGGGTSASSPTRKVTTSPAWNCATAATLVSRTGCGAGRRADWPACPSMGVIT
jgi:hypothetical protein